MEEMDYSVLIYEDELGTWLKIPEFDLQLLTGDLETGLSILEEHLDIELATRKENGEAIPDRLNRAVKHVDKEEYGPTEVELEEERQAAYWEEYGDEEEVGS